MKENSKVIQLKNKSNYRYKLANSKLIRWKNIVEFVQKYFGGHIPSLEEWKDFFVDMMKNYAMGKEIPLIEIEDLFKNARIEDSTDTPKSTLAAFDNKERKIMISQQTVASLSEKNYSFCMAVSTLMHEFRHFYQYEVNGKGSVYKNAFQNIDEIMRGLNLPLISKRAGVEYLFNCIYLVNKDCDFVEEVLSKDKDERWDILHNVAFACYYNSPLERDARSSSSNMIDLIFDDIFNSVDKKTRRFLEKDYKKMTQSLVNSQEHIEIADSYYYKFQSDLKKLTLNDLERIGRISEQSENTYKLFFGLINIIFGENKKNRLVECLKAITKSYPNVYRALFEISNFDREELNSIEKLVVTLSETGNLTVEIMEAILENSKLIKNSSLKEVVLNSLKNNKYDLAIMCYEKWIRNNLLDKDEDPFIEKIVEILKGNLEKVRSGEEDAHIAGEIENFIKLLIEDAYILEEMDEILETIYQLFGDERE